MTSNAAAPPISAVANCGQLKRLVRVAAIFGCSFINPVKTVIAAYRNPNLRTAPVATAATLFFFIIRWKLSTIIKLPKTINGENARIIGAIAALLVKADTNGAITAMAVPLHKPAAAAAISRMAFTIGPTMKLLYGPMNLPSIWNTMTMANNNAVLVINLVFVTLSIFDFSLRNQYMALSVPNSLAQFLYKTLSVSFTFPIPDKVDFLF